MGDDVARGPADVVAARPSDDGVPLWLGHIAAVSWRLLVVLALAALILYLAGLMIVATASVIATGFLAATSVPLHERMRARGLSRTRAALITWLSSWAILAVVGILIAIALLPSIVDLVRAIANGLASLGDDLNQGVLPPQVSDLIQGAGQSVQDWVVAQVSGIASSLATVVSVLIVTFFLSFFVILDADHGWIWAKQFVPVPSRPELERSGREAVDRVGGFVRDAALTSTIRTVIVFVALQVLGVPLAGSLAAIVFLGGFLPYLGGVVTTVAIMLVVLSNDGLGTALVLLALIVAVDIALGRYLRRVVPERPARLHPAAVLAVVLVGAAVAGLAGMFAAVPAAAFVLALSRPMLDALGGGTDADARADPFIPAWLDRIAQWSWRALIGLSLVLALIFIAGLLPMFVGALVMAAVLAATFAPFARYLRKRGLSPTAAALGATAGTAAVATVILVLTVVSLVQQIGAIADAASDGSGSADQATNGLLDWLVQFTPDSTAAIVAVVGAAAVGLVLILLVSVLAGVLTFFLIRDGAAGWAVLMAPLADWRKDALNKAGERSVGALGGYMIGTGILSAVGAVTQWFIMAVLGIPLALPLGVLAFFGGFIPYFGSMIVTGVAFLVTLKFGTTLDIVIMAIFTVVINLVQGSILGPLIYGRAVSIHPGVVLLAVPVGSALAGIVGMFLIIPVLGIIATSWRAVLYVTGDGTDASILGAPKPEPVVPAAPARASPVPADP